MRTLQKLGPTLVVLLGTVGWLIYHFTRPSPEAKVWVSMAKSLGIDPTLWEKVGPILANASEGRCQEVSSSQYKLLSRALDTGNPQAQSPAMMVLINCPPPDGAVWYAKVHAIGLHANDSYSMGFAVHTMWQLSPEKHGELRQEIAAGTYPLFHEDISKWPEKFVRKPTKDSTWHTR